MIERELTDAELAILTEAAEASSNFALGIQRLQMAFEAVLEFNLGERSRLEAIVVGVTNDNGSD